MTLFRLIQGDITEQDTEAIVNAANPDLIRGGGVDGAIHRAAGPELQKVCQKVAPCPRGEARLTPGFRLKARYVIHTAGPYWQGGHKGEEETLRRCYHSVLSLAHQKGIRSLSFPSISTGVYGFPVEKACPIALSEVKKYTEAHPEAFSEIRFICWDDHTYKVYQKYFQEFFGKKT